jgi:carbamoyl-phosphate synthase small subunit
MSKAFLVLDDGRIFEGSSWAFEGITFGEAVFQTGMTGYQETLTDPSYHKQVVVMTAPHIGNTGMNREDNESKKIWVAGCTKDCRHFRGRYTRTNTAFA